eukprot:Skav221094  [mRNA]  locus=scaffold4552:76642:77841:- [translate_table: standard]
MAVMLSSGVIRLVASNLPLRDRIISLRVVSRACLREVASMVTDCLILNGTPSENRWRGNAIHCAKPGCIRQFQPRMLKLQDIAGLPVDEMRRLLEEVQISLKSLTVCGWNPPKLEWFDFRRQCMAARHNCHAICQSVASAVQSEELTWLNPDLPFPLSLRIACSFKNLVCLRLRLASAEFRKEVDILHLQALQVLPCLQELYLVDTDDYPDRCWQDPDLDWQDPLPILCLALAPLQRLRVLDWGEIPFRSGTSSVSSFLGMLKQLPCLAELKTIMFSQAELWDQIDDHAPSLQKLRLLYSDPGASDVSSMVRAVCGSRLPQLRVLQLSLESMFDDDRMPIAGENWPTWLLGQFAQLKDSPLQRIELEDRSHIALNFEELRGRLAEGGVELAGSRDMTAA